MKYSRIKSWSIVFAVCAAAAVSVVLLPGCRTAPPLVDDVTHISADCGAVRSVALHIIDDVTSALVMQDYASGLRRIVTNLIAGVADAERERALETNWAAVACAVQEVERRAGTSLAYGRMDAATTERQEMIRAHASGWLAGHVQ